VFFNKTIIKSIIMETIEKSVEVLNDLIEINNDRAEGFGKAAQDLDPTDMDLQGIFLNCSLESKQFSQQLRDEINQLGGHADNDTSNTGALHRAWIDVKATFTGHDRKGILAECERGEDAIKKAYRDALSPENDLAAEVIPLLLRQQTSIEMSHDRIKSLRDSAS
jgi:uncharacterized protein (TIGR02284 family)